MKFRKMVVLLGLIVLASQVMVCMARADTYYVRSMTDLQSFSLRTDLSLQQNINVSIDPAVLRAVPQGQIISTIRIAMTHASTKNWSFQTDAQDSVASLNLLNVARTLANANNLLGQVGRPLTVSVDPRVVSQAIAEGFSFNGLALSTLVVSRLTITDRMAVISQNGVALQDSSGDYIINGPMGLTKVSCDTLQTISNNQTELVSEIER